MSRADRRSARPVARARHPGRGRRRRGRIAAGDPTYDLVVIEDGVIEVVRPATAERSRGVLITLVRRVVGELGLLTGRTALSHGARGRARARVSDLTGAAASPHGAGRRALRPPAPGLPRASAEDRAQEPGLASCRSSAASSTRRRWHSGRTRHAVPWRTSGWTWTPSRGNTSCVLRLYDQGPARRDHPDRTFRARPRQPRSLSRAHVSPDERGAGRPDGDRSRPGGLAAAVYGPPRDYGRFCSTPSPRAASSVQRTDRELSRLPDGAERRSARRERGCPGDQVRRGDLDSVPDRRAGHRQRAPGRCAHRRDARERQAGGHRDRRPLPEASAGRLERFEGAGSTTPRPSSKRADARASR